MNLLNKWLLTAALLVCVTASVRSRELPGSPQRKDVSQRVDASDCSPASASIDLNINNVRAHLLNGGDMWWDLVNTARYEVPKVEAGSGHAIANSLFAGAIWIGGIDQNNQLKVAAQTYRQTGNDYFPGPLDGTGGTTSADVCNDFDRQWQVLGSEITTVVDAWDANGGTNALPQDQIPTNVLQWPAQGNPYNPIVGDRNLAPFFDRDNDGNYDPTQGDYPTLYGGNSTVYADQMIWWVYNDNGNIHSESGGEPIGMEVQALAFAFQTSDAVNDMTFYKYKLVNKSSSTLSNCYMGQWVDPDLGNPADDYIGCDTVRGLGIVYNADAYDEPGGSGGFYGDQPPLVGIDYFKGPLDESGHELGMSYFLYYNNDFTTTGNPENTSDYYGYLSGKWKDATPFTEGGTAYGGSTPTHFVFPSSPKDPDGWSECAEQNNGADRRIVQSSGPFKLLPGASNDIIVGVVWVQPPVGTYPCPDFSQLLNADEQAQALFDNNFKILDGPPAPTVRIIEEDRRLILAIEDYKKTEEYAQADPQLVIHDIPDSLYRFEGYQIFQLKNSSVSLQQIIDKDLNPTLVQLIATVDLKDGVTKLVNTKFDPTLGDVPSLRAEGEDKGIRHTFEITTNRFATSDKNLINFQTYTFAVLPYAYNVYSKTDTSGVLYTVTYDADSNQILTPVYQTVVSKQKVPYLAGRSLLKGKNLVTAIPHVTEPESGGLIQNAKYGDGPEITRQEGRGNGGLSVTLTDASVNDILLNGFMPTPTYKGAQGPVAVKVYDPKNVVAAEYELALVGVDDVGHLYDIPDSLVNRDNSLTADNDVMLSYKNKWVLRRLNGDSVVAERPIGTGSEQLIPDWGLSVYVQQVNDPSYATSEQSVIDWSITYQKTDQAWLSGIPDIDADRVQNWIWSGTYHIDAPDQNNHSDFAIGNTFDDPTQQYESLFNRTVAPYRLTSIDPLYGPAYGPNDNMTVHKEVSMADLPSLDLVLTSDTTKWTRCVVLETGWDKTQNEGNRAKLTVRAGRSKNCNGSLTSTDPSDIGNSWFPGYAIDPETGMRLNICFGEDSRLIGQNGRDMIWNPTTEITTHTSEIVLGGRQYVYVLKTKYDSCKAIRAFLNVEPPATLSNSDAKKAFANFAWVAEPLVAEGFSMLPLAQGLIPTETTLRIRVNRAYQRFQAGPVENETRPRYTFNTNGLAATRNDLATAKSMLDTIKVVPNPYYAYSNYENSQIDNRVKIVNLPVKCTVTIYALDGTLIRRFKRDDPSSTSMDWDLKNTSGIPIASGIYIIHVDADGIGEKTLKWFGVMRPIDLDSF